LAISILGGNLKRDNPLFRVFKKYETERLPLEVVEYVPQPFNGDKIYIRPIGSGLTERLVNPQHWGKVSNVHMAMTTKLQIRR
jgi:hypothetical protein